MRRFVANCIYDYIVNKEKNEIKKEDDVNNDNIDEGIVLDKNDNKPKNKIIEVVVTNLTPETIEKFIDVIFDNPKIEKVIGNIKENNKKKREMKKFVDKLKYDYDNYYENRKRLDIENQQKDDEIYDNVVNINDYR